MEFWEQPKPAKNPPKLAPLQPEAETQEGPSFFKKNKRLIIIFLVFLLVLAITIFTILFFGQKSSQTQSQKEAKTESKPLTLTQYPPNLVPIYPNSIATRQVALPVNDKKSINVALQNADQPDKVYDFYQKFLEQNGWQISQKGEYENKIWELIFKKGENEGNINITRISENDKNSEIVIFLTYT
jgi:hypothetical protein